MIEEFYEANFETLKTAIREDNAILAECRDQLTRERVVVLCALSEGSDLVPLAKLFDGDPYEELMSPEATQTFEEMKLLLQTSSSCVRIIYQETEKKKAIAQYQIDPVLPPLAALRIAINQFAVAHPKAVPLKVVFVR